jgi:hypothetical protein
MRRAPARVIQELAGHQDLSTTQPYMHLWSSQDSVETLSSRFVSRLELIRTQPAEMTMVARSIVEGIDVVGQVGDRQLAVLVDLFLNPFFLEAAEERLGDSIVPAVAFPAHTRLEVIRAAESAPRVAAVLRSLIRMNQPPARVRLVAAISRKTRARGQRPLNLDGFVNEILVCSGGIASR